MALQRSTTTYLHALVTSASKRCNLATHIFTFLQHLYALVQLLPHHKGFPNICDIFSSDIYSIDFHNQSTNKISIPTSSKSAQFHSNFIFIIIVLTRMDWHALEKQFGWLLQIPEKKIHMSNISIIYPFYIVVHAPSISSFRVLFLVSILTKWSSCIPKNRLVKHK
jgi:hypothetical protein